MAEVEGKKQVRPIVKYRVELQKRLEINKSYKERRNRAAALRILSYGLFGQKRFQNLYLSCSLNCFYWALQIASFLHQRVAGLALIIKFEQVHVIEYYQNSSDVGKSFGEKKYTKILIKLTKSPTEEDKKQPGYNPAFKSEDIKDQLKDVLGGNRGDARRQNRGRGGNRRGQNRRFRDDRGERRGGRDRQYRGDRRQRREDRPERREERPERRERDTQERRYQGERRQRREKDQYRQKSYQRVQREEVRDRPRREERERYPDDRDQRRVYKESQNTQKNERYVRGQQRSRGGPYRPQNTQNRQKRYQPKRAEPKKEEPKYERVDRQNRGERRPKPSRYSDDSD